MITRIMQTKDVAMHPTGEQQNHKVSVRNNKKDVNYLKCSLKLNCIVIFTANGSVNHLFSAFRELLLIKLLEIIDI